MIESNKLMKPDSKKKWNVTEIAPNTFMAESEAFGIAYMTSAHCPACAKVSLIEKRGGWVDIRGLYAYNQNRYLTYTCYDWLSIVNRKNKYQYALPEASHS